jgi:hypothetical protein
MCLAIKLPLHTLPGALRFESSFLLAHSPAEFFAADIDDSARNCPFAYHTEDLPHLLPFTERHCADPERTLAGAVQHSAAHGAS